MQMEMAYNITITTLSYNVANRHVANKYYTGAVGRIKLYNYALTQ